MIVVRTISQLTERRLVAPVKKPKRWRRFELLDTVTLLSVLIMYFSTSDCEPKQVTCSFFVHVISSVAFYSFLDDSNYLFPRPSLLLPRAKQLDLLHRRANKCKW